MPGRNDTRLSPCAELLSPLSDTTDAGVPQAPLSPESENVVVLSPLLVTTILQHLSTARHHALVCLAGSKGYAAFKEMLQNGVAGQTILLESRDVTTIEKCTPITHSQINTSNGRAEEFTASLNRALPHVSVHTNLTSTPLGFLFRAIGLVSIDLHSMMTITQINSEFMSGVKTLQHLDLSSLSNVVSIDTRRFIWLHRAEISGPFTIQKRHAHRK